MPFRSACVLVGVAGDDVDRCAHHGERSAQLVRGVGDESPLALERGLEPGKHRVEGLGKLAELVVRPPSATRADRFCSEAARAAAVMR